MVPELQRKQMPVTYLRIALRDFLLDENDHRAMLASIMMAPAMVAAMDPIRISRFFT